MEAVSDTIDNGSRARAANVIDAHPWRLASELAVIFGVLLGFYSVAVIVPLAGLRPGWGWLSCLGILLGLIIASVTCLLATKLSHVFGLKVQDKLHLFLVLFLVGITIFCHVHLLKGQYYLPESSSASESAKFTNYQESDSTKVGQFLISPSSSFHISYLHQVNYVVGLLLLCVSLFYFWYQSTILMPNSLKSGYFTMALLIASCVGVLTTLTMQYLGTVLYGGVHDLFSGMEVDWEYLKHLPEHLRGVRGLPALPRRYQGAGAIAGFLFCLTMLLVAIGAGYAFVEHAQSFWGHFFGYTVGVGLVEEMSKIAAALLIVGAFWVFRSQSLKGTAFLVPFLVGGLGFATAETFQYFRYYSCQDANIVWYVLRATWCVFLHGSWGLISGFILFEFTGEEGIEAQYKSGPNSNSRVPTSTEQDPAQSSSKLHAVWRVPLAMILKAVFLIGGALLMASLLAVPAAMLHGLYDALARQGSIYMWGVGLASILIGVCILKSAQTDNSTHDAQKRPGVVPVVTELKVQEPIEVRVQCAACGFDRQVDRKKFGDRTGTVRVKCPKCQERITVTLVS